MRNINEQEIKMIKEYKKSKNEKIALYFFDQFHDDIVDIIFYKINSKFSSVPIEKGDLFHLVWKSIKKTLNEYKKKQNFNYVLLRNSFQAAIAEYKKFLTNGELVMNMSGSLENYQSKGILIGGSNIIHLETPNDIVLNNLVDDTYEITKNFKHETIKKILYLKSLGYSITEIEKEIKISRYKIKSLFSSIEKIMKKKYS